MLRRLLSGLTTRIFLLQQKTLSSLKGGEGRVRRVAQLRDCRVIVRDAPSPCPRPRWGRGFISLHFAMGGARSALILAAGLAVIAAQPAAAHAHLDRAEPGVGATLAAAPAQVRIWFTEALEPAFSTITVTDATGGDVGQGKATVDAGNAKLLELGLKTLPPGTYRVKWRVIAVDTHQTEGDYTFTVKP